MRRSIASSSRKGVHTESLAPIVPRCTPTAIGGAPDRLSGKYRRLSDCSIAQAILRHLAFGLSRIRIRGFRSALDVEFSPRGILALVGEASAGKSNLLAATWALLDPGAPEFTPEDASRGGVGTIALEADLVEGGRLSLSASPPSAPGQRRHKAPAALFLPGELRSTLVVARSSERGPAARRAGALFRTALSEQATSTTAPALSFLASIERCCRAGLSGVVLLIEEPELYLRPQAQRYLYRLLREFAAAGNQVLYSTHSPAFLNVGRLEELALVSFDPARGTRVFQPAPLPAEETFRVVSEFDAERGELFLARSAILVEGRTEKLVLPFVFRALGHDPDREAISIIECGGKSNIPLFAQICLATGVPFVAVHDRDAEPGKEPIAAERALNDLVAEVAGRERTFVLEPDFEGIAGIAGHKPESAWRRFSSLAPGDVPRELSGAVAMALELAER
jgi:predicted ATPase